MSKNSNYVKIFDTTLRDGEQSPGASMSLEEKLQISRVFDELGVDVIEAGFPIASPGDFEAVTEIRKMEFDRTVQQAYEESNSIGLKDILKYGVIGALLAGAIMFASMLTFRKKTSST